MLVSITFVVVLAGPADARQANPPWPARCPLRVGVLVDQSESMRPYVGDLRAAVKNLLDSLRDKQSEVTIVGFGSAARTITPLADVAAPDSRGRIKDDIDRLDVLTGDDGGTNWDAAFTAVSTQHLDLVVIVTDGVPTAYGTPPQGVDDETDLKPLTAAVTATDQLKADGTRIVAVGIGLQQTGATGNLARITGPVAGADYYAGEVTDLLHQLYDIAAKACGVPVSALPTPEPPSFPLTEVILGAAATLLLTTLAGLIVHRRRRTPVVAIAATPPAEAAAPNPSISHDDILRRINEVKPPSRRSMSLDFLKEDRPSRDE